MFSATDLLRLGTADTSTDEVKRLAHYCLEIREVLFLLAEDDCELNDKGHCEAHETYDWDGSGCPHKRARDLLPPTIGDEPPRR